MHKISAEFEIVTPMFLAGADQTEQLKQIRPPSVKGALRFWWRALQWSRFRNKCESNDATMQDLHEEEARLFGAAANENNKKFGQSLFNLRVKTKNLDKNEYPKGKDGLTYLLGQGLDDRKSFTGSFIVHLRFKPAAKEEDWRSVAEALMVWGLLGGLGSRVRRGIGSIRLKNLANSESNDIWHAPTKREEYESELRKLLGTNTVTGLPPFTAFSQQTRIDYLVKASNACEALDKMGAHFMQYRSWGNKHNNWQVCGKDSEKNFLDDHDWFKNKNDWREKHPNFHPERIVFGLPHNYGQHESGHINPTTHKRRASPLMFHVHQLNLNEFIGISIFLPAQFLPDGEEIQAGDNSVELVLDDYSVIKDFLDGNPAKNIAVRFLPEKTMWSG